MKRGGKRKLGFALVIVLSLIMLLSFLVVSYLSSTRLDRRTTRNYSQSVRAQDLAMGALQEITDDLKQEIDAGSRQDSTYTINGKRVYIPASAASALPARIGFAPEQFGNPAPDNTLLPFSLIRVSRASDPFFSQSGTPEYPGTLPPNRASAAGSAGRSANGHSFPAERWNKPQFMGAVNPSDPAHDLLPPSNFTAAPPDWVYVTRAGSKAFQGDASDLDAMKALKNPDNMDAVLGRYAFVIYEEGGLLDMNAAGHPSDLGFTQEGADAIRFKSAPAYADLARVPGLGGKEPQLDSLLDWRAGGSLVSLGNHNFARMVESLRPTGFLGNQTGDNPFVSRQDLIEYIRTKLGTSEPLPYLGVFSRSVNAPSWMPQTPPGSARDYAAEADSAASANRNLANVRFTRAGSVSHYNDDRRESTYTVESGDPLLQTRFSLAKLAWLSEGNPETGTGPAENSEAGRAIKACFGLVWDYPGGRSGYSANGGNKCWTYVGSNGTAGSFPGAIKTLDEVAQENREPNFFELLKAALLSGSIGKSPGIALYNNAANQAPFPTGGNGYNLPLSAANATMAGVGGLYDEWLDYAGRTVPAPSRVPDMQILQIGANMIDQCDADSWPTAIYFKYAGVDTFDPAGPDGHPLLGPVTMVFGQENLPYLTRLAQINCSPARTGSGPSGPNDDATTVLAGWRQPELWNPYQEPSANSIPPPGTFQIRAYGASQTYFNQTSLTAPITGTWPPGYYGGSAASPAYPWWGRASGVSNAVRYFTTNSATETSDVGTISITDNTASAAFRAHPVLTTIDIPNVQVTSPAAVRADPPSGDNVAKTGYPYYDETGNATWNPRTNHFVAFATGETVKTPPNLINSGPDKFKQPFWVWRSSTNVGSNGVDIGFGPATSYAMGWVDAGGNFHPYSFITGVFPHAYCVLRRSTDPAQDSRVGQVQFENRGFNYNMWTRADPRTSRFSTQVKAFGGGTPPGNNSLFPQSGIGWSFGKDTRPVGAGFNYSATLAFNCRDWLINASSSIHGTAFSSAWYADPDGIVRPGDGIFASDTTGDGILLFTSNAAPAGTGVSSHDIAGNTRHGRRPVILNRPFRTVGELGFVFRDLPFKSLDFFTTESADTGLLDLFCVADTAVVAGGSLTSVMAGKVNPNTAPAAVLQALLSGGSKKALDASYNFSATESGDIAANVQAIVNPPAGSRAPFLNPSDMALRLGSSPFTGSGPVRNALSSSPDKGNKAYLEGVMRILSDSSNMRTWNLMIDVVAQSGRMAPLATTLDGFIVEGEKRYWLHLAIDRYTGRIVDQQLEAVHE